MPMKLENEFTVQAPVEEVWPALLDIARVAECLPGATIEPGQEDGRFRGRMRIKLGPVTTVYEGAARLQDVDDDTHTASIAVTAKEAKGQGTASALITNRLEAVNGRTRVIVGTDLAITGRQAQFGRGIMQDVAARMMSDFAQRFETQISAGARGDEPAPGADSAAPGPQAASRGTPHAGPREGEPEALDLGNVLAASPQIRYALGAGLLALLAVVLFRGRRSRQEISLEFRIRR
jgi:uncharacterized protein